MRRALRAGAEHDETQRAVEALERRADAGNGDGRGAQRREGGAVEDGGRREGVAIEHEVAALDDGQTAFGVVAPERHHLDADAGAHLRRHEEQLPLVDRVDDAREVVGRVEARDERRAERVHGVGRRHDGEDAVCVEQEHGRYSTTTR